MIDFSTIFRPFFDRKSKKNRYEKWSKKWSIFKSIFSSILVDFGLHFGAPAVHHSPGWASWAALRRCLGPSCAILCDLLRVFAPLGSIFGPLCSSWPHFRDHFRPNLAWIFWFGGPFFDDSGVARCSLCVCFLFVKLSVCFCFLLFIRSRACWLAGRFFLASFVPFFFCFSFFLSLFFPFFLSLSSFLLFFLSLLPSFLASFLVLFFSSLGSSSLLSDVVFYCVSFCCCFLLLFFVGIAPPAPRTLLAWPGGLREAIKFAGPSAHGVSDPGHTCFLHLGS